MSEIEIVWKEPPAREPRSKWLDALAPLRDRPGQWAMVRADTPQRVSNLRSRLVKNAAIRQEFELRAHRIDDDSGELYARTKPPTSA